MKEKPAARQGRSPADIDRAGSAPPARQMQNPLVVRFSLRAPKRVWLVPGSQVEPDDSGEDLCLEWWTGPLTEPRPVNGCLDEFARLGKPDATPEQVLRFARKWGCLGLWPVTVPFMEVRFRGRDEPSRLGYMYQFKGINVPVSARQTFGELKTEPLSTWFAYARRVRGLMRLAGNLSDGKRGDVKDWQAVEGGQAQVIPWRQPGHRLTPDQWVQHERALVAAKVSGMLEQTWFVPVLNWEGDADSKASLFWSPPDGDQWKWRGGGPGRTQLSFNVLTGRGETIPAQEPSALFGALALELATRLTGVRNCEECGEPFALSRRPGRPQRYCEGCAGPVHKRQKAASKQRERTAGPGVPSIP